MMVLFILPHYSQQKIHSSWLEQQNTGCEMEELWGGQTGKVLASSACHKHDCSHKVILLTEEGIQNDTLRYKNAMLLILLLGSRMKERENSSVEMHLPLLTSAV